MRAHTVLPRRLTMPTVVTIHDLLPRDAASASSRVGRDGQTLVLPWRGAPRIEAFDTSSDDDLGHGRSRAAFLSGAQAPARW